MHPKNIIVLGNFNLICSWAATNEIGLNFRNRRPGSAKLPRMKLFSISLKQILFLSAVIGIGHLIFRFIISPRIPYSKYFQHDIDKLKKQIKMHRETGLRALEQYRSKIPGTVFASPSAKRLCVGITSVYRKDVAYLEQTVASLLTRAPLSYQDKIHLTVYNLDDPPSKHLNAKDLSKLVKVQNGSYKIVDPDAGPFERRRIKVKEFLDYIVVLKEEQKRGCQYYLILEDDVLAAQDWAEKTLKLLDEIDVRKEDYSVVKLFTMEFFQPAKWMWSRWTDYFLITGLTLLFAVVIYSAMIFGARAINKLMNREVPEDYELKNPEGPPYWGHFTTFNLIAFLGLLGGTLSWVLNGNRVSFVREPVGLSERELGAMYQANLYSADALDRWIDFMTDVYVEARDKGIRLQPKDVYVDDFNAQQREKYQKQFKSMIYTPNIFQHTGIESSIGNTRTVHSAMISYSFPDDDTPITFDEEYIKGTKTKSKTNAKPKK